MPTLISFPVDFVLSWPVESETFPIHLGDVAGRRYLALPDGTVSPSADEVKTHRQPLPDDTRRSLLVVQQIDRICQEKIRSRFTLEDELGALRTGDTEVLAFIAQCVAEAKGAKAALGV